MSLTSTQTSLAWVELSCEMSFPSKVQQLVIGTRKCNEMIQVLLLFEFGNDDKNIL